MNLKFHVKDKIVEILDSGDIEFLSLYKSIRKWEASVNGIVFDEVIDGSGNIDLPDGTRTPRTMIFINEWKLISKENVSIVGGYVTGRDSSNKYTNPIASESQFQIYLLSNPTDETLFIPTEAQKNYAIEQGDLTSKDWEIIIEPNPVIRRKHNASRDSHSIFGLYWFLKQEWLRNHKARIITFPIRGDNQIPREGIDRRYELLSPWVINKDDIKYLHDGPLIFNGKQIVSASEKHEKNEREALKLESNSFLNILKKIFNNISSNRSKSRINAKIFTEKDINKKVTIGVVTALPIEFSTMLKQLDTPIDYSVSNGRFNMAVKIGSIPAYGSGMHIIALTMCDPGNNISAITATQLQNGFPNMQEVIMVGIAGAVPNPVDPETHVRLGDIVISGPDGVIQYDMIKKHNENDKEHRHRPRPPSAQMLKSVRMLESERISGNRPWMQSLERTNGISGTKRPSIDKDILTATNNPSEVVKHPT